MIREITLTRYRCTCSKCVHEWKTKTHDIPKVCPSCHRITWNDDHQPITLDLPTPIPGQTHWAIGSPYAPEAEPILVPVDEDFDFGA